MTHNKDRKSMAKLARLLTRLQRYADRPWYAPLLSTSATLDYFILASPAQSLFITTVLLNPSRRVYAALCFSCGAALGALLLAGSVQLLDVPLDTFLPNPAELSSDWQHIRVWIDTWGLWALLGLSIIPLPLRSVVVLAALAGLSLFTVGLGVLLGRLLVLMMMGQILYQAPSFLMRIPFIRRFIEKFSTHHIVGLNS